MLSITTKHALPVCIDCLHMTIIGGEVARFTYNNKYWFTTDYKTIYYLAIKKLCEQYPSFTLNTMPNKKEYSWNVMLPAHQAKLLRQLELNKDNEYSLYHKYVYNNLTLEQFNEEAKQLITIHKLIYPEDFTGYPYE